jgi:diguanylate cyclase (GGDEF)-like protein
MEQRNNANRQSKPFVPPENQVTFSRVLKALEGMELFMPRVLVNDTHLTNRATDAAQHRGIAQMIVAIFLISLLSIAAQGYNYYQMASTVELQGVVISLYFCAYLYAVLALLSFKYLHRSTSILSNSYAGFTLSLTLGIHALTGLTMSSPVVPLYFFIPAWAFLSCSNRAGVWWSIIIGIVFASVTVIDPVQLNLPNIIPAHELASVHLTNAIAAIVMIGICLYAHQDSFLALTDQLDEDRLLYEHKARHDAMTGLANREQFDINLQQALEGVNWKGQEAALIYIDLNDFKIVNDTHGHQVGDSVLQITAQRIKALVRESDTTARLGGDEFGIVLPHLEDTNIVTRIVTQLEEKLAQPMQIGDISVSISGSVGLAIAPTHGREASSLTRQADRDMYDAKSAKARLKIVRSG